ncbi:hypothetical protein JDV02_000555 [Purpureocillium takamizusanense]|uniref:Uncharacterized protein n=1 Tax=Purpureocillium takamizusanense TaxID=2060973 RepID=A0A9Q8Q6W2_9HYPO|nr:uncharacterized protein JDV02_000555 [Purpureocillium takamizusanense]UNI13857.1 hypothetical protein JDV02_000555 [Purpureocillium takamizusanense]
MLSLNVLAVAVIATGASAAVITPRLAHQADFRVFGATGCKEKNLGIWTVIEGDVKPGECKGLNGDDVHSITNVDILKGCSLFAFTDDKCTTEKHPLEVGKCTNSDSGFKAWTISCE